MQRFWLLASAIENRKLEVICNWNKIQAQASLYLKVNGKFLLFKDISEITGDQRGLIYTQKLTMSLFCCATEDLKLSLMLSGTLVYVKERSTQDPAK